LPAWRRQQRRAGRERALRRLLAGLGELHGPGALLAGIDLEEAGSGETAREAILANPRYAGCEVWNKQRKDEVLIDVEDVGLGHETRMRWNDTTQWVWSQEPAHEAIITTETNQLPAPGP